MIVSLALFVDRYGKRFRCLIPLNAVAIAAALVVFQRIGERGGIATEREVIRGVGCKDDRATHVEAMEVARERGGGHGKLVGLEVVARREADVPSVADAYVAAHIECLGKFIRIAHALGVESAGGVFAHDDTVAKGENFI